MKKTSLLNKNLSSEEEKLEHYKKKEVLNDLVITLSKEDDSAYYLPTIQVAGILADMIKKKEGITHEQWDLVKDLSTDDIHVLLAHKE